MNKLEKCAAAASLCDMGKNPNCCEELCADCINTARAILEELRNVTPGMRDAAMNQNAGTITAGVQAAIDHVLNGGE